MAFIRQEVQIMISIRRKEADKTFMNMLAWPVATYDRHMMGET
jgi:hypothetical protein